MTTKIDPTTLLSHPLPVRNLILQIPTKILSPLLMHHAGAYQPIDPVVTSITPTGLTITYLQPLRESWYNPIPRSASIPFAPPLPPLPAPSTVDTEETNAWESACAARLKEMAADAEQATDDRSDIQVTRYLPPRSAASLLSMLWFLALTGAVFAWLARGEDVPVVGGLLKVIWNRPWKFDATVVVHAGLLVRKWRDVVLLAGRLRRHGVDRKRWVWLLWLVNVAVEGWRCAERFEEEVKRVGRGMAAERVSGEGESKKAK